MPFFHNSHLYVNCGKGHHNVDHKSTVSYLITDTNDSLYNTFIILAAETATDRCSDKKNVIAVP